MVAEEGVGPEGDAVDPHEIHAVLEVAHEGLDRRLDEIVLTIVVPGAASIPMIPPRSAQARMTSVRLALADRPQLAGPEWEMTTGTFDA